MLAKLSFRDKAMARFQPHLTALNHRYDNVSDDEPVIRQPEINYNVVANNIRRTSSETLTTSNRSAVMGVIASYSISYLTFLFSEIPLIRILEESVCNRALGSAISDSDESRCKIFTVQSEVALLLGVKVALEAFAGMT